MRHILIICIYFLTIPTFGIGQNMRVREMQRQERPNQRNENKIEQREVRTAERIKRVQAIKVAFISKQLELTPAQFDKFWPLYNQYQTELMALQMQRRENNTNAQANGLDQLDKDSFLEQKIFDTKKHYKNEFLKILPPEKVSMIYKSEKLFYDEAIKRRGEMKNEPGN